MLPKIKQPIFTMEIPSNKKSVKYRPFTVAEEKLLMIAKESNDNKDIVNVYRQIINNCILDTIDVDKLAYFDLEYIFLMLRAKSVSNVVDLQIKDEDGNTYPVKYDLDNVKISEQKLMKLQQFFETLPKVYGDVEYKRKDGTVVKHKLEGMQSFFG